MTRPEDIATDAVNSTPSSDRERRRIVFFWDGGSMSADLIERGTATLGRASSCTICVDHRSVSRAHAAFHIGSSVVVEDLGSANGTFVDGRRLTVGERVALAPGAVGACGVVSFVVVEMGARSADESPTVMARLRHLVEIVSGSEISVIISGETGAGKEVIAQQIHGRSARARGPFIRLNCAALPDALLESELFGHERGSFTGAVQAKVGLMEAASGGTLFLDEIGEMAPPTQAKLLRAIEAREITRIGSVTPRTLDVRFVAATHRDLEAMVAEDTFRQDLYFRLNGITLWVPPLRARKAEIAELARGFAAEARGRSGDAPPKISDRAIAALREYDWPGNVRELKNVVERAVLFARGEEIRLEHVDVDPSRVRTRSLPPPSTPTEKALPSELAALERARIVEALEKSAGNQTEAARLLGISRRTLLYRLDTYDLPRPRRRT